jgi:ATP-dependent protease ClpP protease subunit
MSRRITGVKAKLLHRLSQINPDLANDIRNVKLPWYTIGNQFPTEDELLGEPIEQPKQQPSPETDETDIFIFEEIGGSFGIDASQFVLDLQKIKTGTINVHINSPGGSVNDAISIYNSLVYHSATVNTYVNAMAASAASIIAMAGDKVVMMVGSQLMIHDAMSSELGNPRELRELADWLDAQSNNLASMYAARAGRTTKFWRNKMIAETWMFADEAVNLGLANEVFSKKQPPPPEPMPMEEPPEDAIPSTEDGADASNRLNRIDVLAVKHTMTNRGYKYVNRDKAPSPLDVVPVLDDDAPLITADMQARERRAAALDMLRNSFKN